MFELILDFGVVFRMNFSLTCMTGMFLDFGDDVAGYFFESMSFNSFCMLLCMCMLPSSPKQCRRRVSTSETETSTYLVGCGWKRVAFSLGQVSVLHSVCGFRQYR